MKKFTIHKNGTYTGHIIVYVVNSGHSIHRTMKGARAEVKRMRAINRKVRHKQEFHISQYIVLD